MAAPAREGLIARVIGWALQRKPVRALLLYTELRGPMLADSITYRTLFSVFAAVFLGFSLAALWLTGNPAAWQALVDAVDAAIPGLLSGRGSEETGLIDVSTIQAPAGLTVASVVALIALVGAAIGAIGSLRSSLRTLADRIHDDVFWVWVLMRNFLLALAIGGGFALSAAAGFVGTNLIGLAAGYTGARPQTEELASQVLSIAVVFALDAALLTLVFVALGGIRPSARVLWPGVLWGAVGLSILQQLSGLFVRGAAGNPLLASFAALIALLLWLNLSAQVILIAWAYVVTGVAEEHDRVRERLGARTFEQRRVHRAEDAVRVATEELENARRHVLPGPGAKEDNS